MSSTKTKLPFSSIFNMNFGFFGIQFGWGLQMANMSAIYAYLGASDAEIPGLWLAAPLTGLIIQPIIGQLSDRTWLQFLGRRRPYILIGAILSTLALILMPNSISVFMAATLLWVLDGSINASMQPFRALVADTLPEEQKSTGYALQSFFIGLGGSIASFLPLYFKLYHSSPASAAENAVPDTVRFSFYVGAAAYFIATLWSVFTTKEIPPSDEELSRLRSQKFDWTLGLGEIFARVPASVRLLGLPILVLLFLGIYSLFPQASQNLKDTTIFGLKLLNFSVLLFSAWFLLVAILVAPTSMRRIALTQFFTWVALMCMWTQHNSAITKHIFLPAGLTAEDANIWNGVCFGTYNVVCFLFSLFLIPLSRRLGLRLTHGLCLAIGGIGLALIPYLSNKYQLLIPMICVGIAWASILAIPYTIVSTDIPAEKMGLFMGIFNLFVVVPQVVATQALGPIMEAQFQGNPVPVMTIAGLSFILAALCMTIVRPAPATSSSPTASAGH
ncbi:MAG: MFS transporter [Methylacidiphilales bacterium]|nr:MFS transporter [Candidatus Methylacidiphilales bacterium]MDW8349147.1 MFS transporter [Verrucomicrobiae bacterium]